MYFICGDFEPIPGLDARSLAADASVGSGKLFYLPVELKSSGIWRRMVSLDWGILAPVFRGGAIPSLAPEERKIVVILRSAAARRRISECAAPATGACPEILRS
jgi:hypothetical protein